MTTTITIHIREIAGESMIDTQGTALLYGVNPDAVAALPLIDGAIRIPTRMDEARQTPREGSHRPHRIRLLRRLPALLGTPRPQRRTPVGLPVTSHVAWRRQVRPKRFRARVAGVP